MVRSLAHTDKQMQKAIRENINRQYDITLTVRRSTARLKTVKLRSEALFFTHCFSPYVQLKG